MKPKLRTALYFAGAIIIAALISAGVTMQLYNCLLYTSPSPRDS